MATEIERKRSMLIINPNTTQSMTDGLKTLVDRLGFEGTHYSYFTASSGVPSINNEHDAAVSAGACLQLLTTPEYLDSFDGFLVCCFSHHPLVAQLRAAIARYQAKSDSQAQSQKKKKIVIGIFEASTAFCLQTLNSNEPFGIVSTGAQWEAILDSSVADLLGTQQSQRSFRYVGTSTTGLNADELHSVDAADLGARMEAATRRVVAKGAKAVVLGCAGMVGLEGMVRRGCVAELGESEGGKVRIVDGVVCGVMFLEGALRAGV